MLIDVRWLQFIFEHRSNQQVRRLPQIPAAAAG
ncbi:Uncharacterised protein [Mycolicibacter terrae]|nr:Uncharacterised protein [Mycolicibacter terrae]